MLTVPAIDLIGGACVRLTEGDYGRATVYDADPVAVAVRFRDEGAPWMHVVDLDGAKAGYPVHLSVVKRLAQIDGIRIQVGGGLRQTSHIEEVLAAGASRAIVGTRLLADAEWASQTFRKFGERIVAGVDTRDGKVATHGWMETSDLDGVEFGRQLQALGCKRVIFTDISRDGRLVGPNVEAVRQMVEALDVPVVASGGVSALEDLVALGETGCEATIVGKALYEGKLDLRKALAVMHGNQ